MKFYFRILQFSLIFTLIECIFKVDRCDYDELINLEKFHEFNSPDRSDRSPDIDLYLSIDDISNLDYISNVFQLQLTLVELWKDVNITYDFLEDNEMGTSLIKESKHSSIEIAYPNLLLDESIYHENLNGLSFKQFYFFRSNNLLVKRSKLSLQIRCIISIFTYPFIYSPCFLNFFTASEFHSRLNYTICNLNRFLNQKFIFNKFQAEVVSLSVPQDCNLENRHFFIYSNSSCFQLQIAFKSSKRFFYIHYLITFSLLLISYLSLWIPIYNHTSRCAMLTFPLFGIYLFDQTLFKNDELIRKECVALHVWRLACLLYISFSFLCYVLAFYSLEMVKELVEKYDIGYLGYLLKCANLVDNESAFKNGHKDELHLILPSKKLSVTSLGVRPSFDLNKIGLEIKKSIEAERNSHSLRVRKFNNTIESAKKPLSDRIKSMKSKSPNQGCPTKSIKPIDSVNEQAKPIENSLAKDKLVNDTPKTSFEDLSLKDKIEKNLKKDLDNLKRDLTNAKDDKQLDREKAKTLQTINDILSFKTPDRKNFRRKKIVSRFISSSKLRTIEFISLIPSDRYAQTLIPFSFFLFVYFYVFHFIM